MHHSMNNCYQKQRINNVSIVLFKILTRQMSYSLSTFQDTPPSYNYFYIPGFTQRVLPLSIYPSICVSVCPSVFEYFRDCSLFFQIVLHIQFQTALARLLRLVTLLIWKMLKSSRIEWKFWEMSNIRSPLHSLKEANFEGATWMCVSLMILWFVSRLS